MALRPTETVTFLFSDVEGSTALLRRLGAADYALALDVHRVALRLRPDTALTRPSGCRTSTAIQDTSPNSLFGRSAVLRPPGRSTA